MADRGVAGHVFHQVNGALVRPADQGPLDAAMLVAERDLQVEDLLAVALEAEMPRLDDAGVNRADRDLVDLLAFDPEKVGDADDRGLARLPAPRVVAGAVRAMKANRLEPGMAFGTDPVLLGELPLEEVDLRAVGRQRGKPVRVQRRLADAQQRAGAVGEDGVDVHVADESATSPKRAATRCPPLDRVDDGRCESRRTAVAGPAPAGSPGPFAGLRSCCAFIASPPRMRRPRAGATPEEAGCRGPAAAPAP